MSFACRLLSLLCLVGLAGPSAALPDPATLRTVLAAAPARPAPSVLPALPALPVQSGVKGKAPVNSVNSHADFDVQRIGALLDCLAGKGRGARC